MTERACDHDTDRIADEFRQLIDAVVRRAEEYLGRDPVSGTRDRCPLCALLAMARGERSDWIDGLTARFAALLASLREALATDARPDSPPDEPGGRSAKVRRVDVHRVRGTVLDREDPLGADPDSTTRAGDAGC